MIPNDLAELANHLWQSTLCLAAAWGLTLLLAKNRAAVRYWIWLAASAKFLVPLALLVSIGGQLGWRSAPVAAQAQFSVVMNEIGQPFLSEPFVRRTPAPEAAANILPRALGAIWICGFAVSVWLWVRCWFEMRTTLRESSPWQIDFPIPVRLSATRLEPGVFGIWRPVLLLPEGITDRLAPDQLKAILVHELCHVRRGDNLTASIQLMVETLFWFFPPVWWLQARLLEERERACDEEVLRLGSDPRIYAEGILNVCKSYFEAPLHFVSGVSGSDLKKRIQAVLASRIVAELSFAKKAILTAAALAVLGVPIAVGIVDTPNLRAQSAPGTAQKFETASIQPCEAFHGRKVLDLSPGNFRSECTTLERLIQQAYGLFANGRMDTMSFVTVAQAPAWAKSELFEIHASAKGAQSQAIMNGPMLQGLLEDRFKLKLHRESGEAPVYVLKLAPGGAKPQPFEGSCLVLDADHPAPQAKREQSDPVQCGSSRLSSKGFDLQAATMADLSTFVVVVLQQRVRDETGLTGRFNFHADFTDDLKPLIDFSHGAHSLQAFSPPDDPKSDPGLIAAATSLIGRLGLKLDSTKGPGEFLVIDHVEKPSM